MTQLRWNLILPFAASIALALYAQYLFAQRDAYWYDSAAIYLAAMLLFLWVARHWRDAPALAEAAGENWQARVREWARRDPLRAGLIVMGVVLSLGATSATNRAALEAPLGLPVALWLLGNACYVAAFVPWRSLRAINWGAWARGLAQYADEIALVAAIVGLALLLRTFDLGNIPISLGGDEAEMGLQARDVLWGRLTNPFATSWFSHPTMFFFLQSLALRVFGTTVFGLRFLSALIGTLTVLAMYLLVRELHTRWLAAVTAILLAVYPYHIQFSRIGLNNIADPFWAATVFLLTIHGINSRRIGYFVAAGLAMGLSQYFYHGVRLVPAMLAVLVAYWLLQEPRRILSQIGSFVVMLGGALITLAPLILYYVNNSHLFMERYNQQGIFPSGWLTRETARTGESAASLILDRVRQKLLQFNFIPDTSGFYGPHTPLLDWLAGVLFIFGLAYAIYRVRDRSYFLFVMWFFVGLVSGAVLIIDEAGSARTVTLTAPLMFFVGLGLVKLAEIAARLFDARAQSARALVAAGLVILTFMSLKFYFIDYTPKRAYSGETGWINTDMVKFLLRYRDPFKAYFYGPPFNYLAHSIFRYMYPGLNGMDVLERTRSAPSFVDRTRTALFIFIPPRAGEFQYVQQAYPNGTRLSFKHPDGRELFFIYEVKQP